MLSSCGLISIVVPTYNERGRAVPGIESIQEFLDAQGADYEIIVVDGGSPDGTADAVAAMRSPRLSVIRQPSRLGKGSGVKEGMDAAKGRYILFTDCDQSTTIDHLPALLEPMIKDGYRIAMGSRSVPGSTILNGQSWFRRQMGRSFGLLAKSLLVRGYRDSQCGFKCFDRDAATVLFGEMTTMNALFDFELIVLAARHGYRIAEVPVTWRYDPDTRLAYGLKGSFRLFLELLRMRKRWGVGWPLKADVTVVSRPGT